MSGDQAIAILSTSAEAQERYESVSSVSGEATVNAGLSRSFKQDQQYYEVSYHNKLTTAEFQNYNDKLNLKYFKAQAGFMKPFDQRDAASIQAWRDFFARSGSHVIVKVSYGVRLMMVCSLCSV